ncbi:MAG: sugar ABC transporter substrate-binding protein [Chloroflexota bacterium]|nr:sugar ABC transporter substrate-binding protein [Chloroflexota bacterium]
MPDSDEAVTAAEAGAAYPTRRRALAAVPAAVTALSLAACAGFRDAATPSSSAGSGTLPAELSWMGWSMEQEFLTPAYEEAAAGFATKHSGSKLVLLPTAEYRQKYTTLVAAGTPPDAADMHWQQHVRDVGPAGLALDVSPYLKKDPYPKDYLGWDPYAWQKKQYAVPSAVQGTGLFYNQGLFDEAGVKYPDDDWTWDQFVDAARRLTKPGGDDNSTIWGAGDQGGTNVGWMNALFHAFGGGFFTPDYRATRFMDKETLEAMEFRATWGPRLKIARNVPGGTSGQFTGGRMAMVISGSWFVANVKRATTSALNTGRVPWDVAPLPRGPKRHGGLTAELGIGIPAGAKNPDASWLAVRHLTSREGLLPFARIGRYIPPLRSLWNEAIPADGMPKGFKKTFLDPWEKLDVPSPFLPDFQQIIPSWEEEGGKVWTGERPARDGAAALARLFDDYLKRLKTEGKL